MSGIEQGSAEPASAPAFCRVAVLRGIVAEHLDAANRASDLDGVTHHPLFSTEEKKPVDCNACGGTAKISKASSTGVEADQCLGSGSCEWSMAQMHPELYQDSGGNPTVREVYCAGIACKALIKGVGTDQPELVGECKVDIEGEEWRENRGRRFKAMRPNHEDLIEGSDRWITRQGSEAARWRSGKQQDPVVGQFPDSIL